MTHKPLEIVSDYIDDDRILLKDVSSEYVSIEVSDPTDAADIWINRMEAKQIVAYLTVKFNLNGD